MKYENILSHDYIFPQELNSSFTTNKIVPSSYGRRVVFLDEPFFSSYKNRSIISMELKEPNTTIDQENHTRRPDTNRNCTTTIEEEEWQTRSFPNCNTFHELMDINTMEYLNRGWFRTTWKVIDDDDDNEKSIVVMKMLRLDREYYEEYYELHRRDAIAMERMSYSEFVVDIYGYCGQAAINEYANFRWNTLENFNRQLRNFPQSTMLHRLKLQLATRIAVGVAHVHENSIMHYDLNPRNVAMMGNDGRPKLNDFNTCEFGRQCQFLSRLHEPWWRAPEEMNTTSETFINEKVDVYALGNLLHSILTTRAPRGKMKPERKELVRDQVQRGIIPKIESRIKEQINASTELMAIENAMMLCYEPDPTKRPTSRQIADMLLDSYQETKSSIEDNS